MTEIVLWCHQRQTKQQQWHINTDQKLAAQTAACKFLLFRNVSDWKKIIFAVICTVAETDRK